MAKAGPPALALGGQPLPMARAAGAQVQKDKKLVRKARQQVPPTGREQGGPACIGCRHYGLEAGRPAGICAILDKSVASTNRRPCASYQIWHAARLPTT